jgi:hypothetical protein
MSPITEHGSHTYNGRFDLNPESFARAAQAAAGVWRLQHGPLIEETEVCAKTSKSVRRNNVDT